MKNLAEKLVLSKAKRYSDDFRNSTSTSGHNVKDLELSSPFGKVRFKEVVSPGGTEEPLEVSAQLNHGFMNAISISSVDAFSLGRDGSLVEARGDKAARMADKVRVLARVAFGKPSK